jgi:signal peptidase I
MAAKAPKGSTIRRVLWEYFESLLIAVFIAVLLRAFVISAYKIPTASMAPTLMPGDFVFCYKLPFGFRVPFIKNKVGGQRLPVRGEVVVFRFPIDEEINFIKRVVGLPGDRIEIKGRKLYINEIEAKYEPVSMDLDDEIKGKEYYDFVGESIGDGYRVLMYRKGESEEDFGPKIVPPGHVFVLGDNRDTSDDSRSWGFVPVEKLEGRVWLIWLSLKWNRNRDFPGIRWERLFSSVK